MRNSALLVVYIVFFEERLIVLFLPLRFVLFVFFLGNLPADFIGLIR